MSNVVGASPPTRICDADLKPHGKVIRILRMLKNLAVKFDLKERLYVTEFLRNEILRINIETENKEIIYINLSLLDNLAFDSKGGFTCLIRM